MKKSIKQISELSGFSPATVSNVLNNKKGVNKDTVELVMKIAREVGYLSERRINTIKLVVYKKNGEVISDTPFFSALIEGVERESRANGYDTAVCNLTQDSDEFEPMLRQILTDHTCGILLLATELDEEDIAPFKDAVAPVVVLDGWFESMAFDAVLINNTDSVCNAVAHLIAMGHKQIGYLKSRVQIQNFRYREIGWRRALENAGIAPEPAFNVALSPSMEGAYRDMSAYLDTKPALPTAFAAANDMIALGAMKALQEHGLRVPEDISVIGFDDMPFCEISSPALTTIRVFKQEMGQMAVRQLVHKIQSDSGVKTKIQICTEFVERKSVKKL